MHRWSPVVLAQETTAVMLLIHTVAIWLYLSTALILLRALLVLRRNGERLPGFFLIAVLMVAASLSRVAWLLMVWLGLDPPPWLDLLVMCLVYAAFMTTPIILSGSYLTSTETDAKVRSHLFLHRAIILNLSVGTLVALFAAVHNTRGIFLASISITCIVSAILLWARISSLKSLEVRRRGLLLFAVFTSTGLLIVAGILVYGASHHVLVRRVTVTATALEFSSALIVVGMLFVFANLRLADVIVKRVLRLTLWLCTALGVWAGIRMLSRSLPFSSDVRPGAFRELLSVALIAAFGAITPLSLRLLDRWIDRWIFQQPDFDAANKELWDRIICRETSDAVFDEARDTIGRTLSLPEVRVTAMEPVADGQNASPGRPGPHFPDSSDERRQTAWGRADVLIPLFVEGSANHWIVLTRGAMRPPLTAMELAFVDRVVGQVQVRLETMLAEQRRLQDLRREAAFREELTDAELRALRAQINPHFLFNSLNTIADLTVTAPERAEKMTLRLSAVFRYVLINTDKQFATLKEELNFARSYLEIEEFRFGDRLHTLFEIDPDVLDVSIPTLLLQPLIENALKHGLAPRRSGGTITITARSDPFGVTLVVADDGVGLSGKSGSQFSGSTNVGLSNVRRRLATAYQERARLFLNPRDGGGTEAVVTIDRIGGGA